MEYIKNGNFEDGLEANWKIIQPPVTLGQESDRYHATFGADAKLIQNFYIPDNPTLLTLSMEVKVDGGSGAATGQVQLVLEAQAGSQDPSFITLNITEHPIWRPYSVTLHTLPANLTSGALELLVQRDFHLPVHLRNISVNSGVVTRT
ncbi:MAG: hypothetical protein JWQ69_2768 [Pseudomonas sp.]|nr:hypothetical protein [Pseudomonas sp.]